MFYYLYQITNNLNGKIYVGVHKTTNMNDGYMGSGKVIKAAIKKHGVENFSKVILQEFSTSEEMYAAEKEVVTDDFLAREDTYNILRGGHGGFDYINKTPGLNNRLIPGYNKSISPFSNPDLYGTETVEQWREVSKTSIKPAGFWTNGIEAMCKYWEDNGREKLIAAQNTSEAKEKKRISYERIAHQQGEKNSQFGTVWITDGNVSLKIKKCDEIPLGWRKGRVTKQQNPSVYPLATNELKG